ncbi:hypothetical protein LINGRAHAP2_LOCUS30417 [Linum grandiflorum]
MVEAVAEVMVEEHRMAPMTMKIWVKMTRHKMRMHLRREECRRHHLSQRMMISGNRNKITTPTRSPLLGSTFREIRGSFRVRQGFCREKEESCLEIQTLLHSRVNSASRHCDEVTRQFGGS